MRLDNFISFGIVTGFFLGLLISVLKFDSAEMITIFTFFVTIAFYLIVLLSSSFFIRFFDFKNATVHKKRYDDMLDFYDTEFDKREKVTDKIREFLRSIESVEGEETVKKPRVSVE